MIAFDQFRSTLTVTIDGYDYEVVVEIDYRIEPADRSTGCGRDVEFFGVWQASHFQLVTDFNEFWPARIWHAWRDAILDATINDD